MGFPVGVLAPLPRTPHVYEEQTSWRLEEEPLMREEVWRSNYQSVDLHTDFAYSHFEEECQEGLMEKLTLEQAKEKYGDKIAISSLAVLVEENHQGKRRIIHDATHGRHFGQQQDQMSGQSQKSQCTGEAVPVGAFQGPKQFSF